MELKRTKGPAVYIAQSKNRRFAGLGYQYPIQLRTKGLAVNDFKIRCRLGHRVYFCFFATFDHAPRLVVLTARPLVLNKPVG